jgi:hypothetical protein
MVLVMAACVLSGKNMGGAGRELSDFANSWQRYAAHQESDWQQATDWIRQHTPPEAVILAPPWEGDFSILAERASVVGFKRAPHDRAITEWLWRMEAVNGGVFRSRGAAMLDELPEHYAWIGSARAEALGRQFGASYFLAVRPVAELEGNKVFGNRSYVVYCLPFGGEIVPNLDFKLKKFCIAKQ